MQKTGHNQRRNFLKLIPLAVVSIGAFSIFRSKRSDKYSEKKYKTLSKAEADQIIRNEKFSVSTRMEPAPAPVANKTIKG